jgi:hypothetical protein
MDTCEWGTTPWRCPIPKEPEVAIIYHVNSPTFGGHESSDNTSSKSLWYPMPTRSHYARLGSFQKVIWIFLGDGLRTINHDYKKFLIGFFNGPYSYVINGLYFHTSFLWAEICLLWNIALCSLVCHMSISHCRLSCKPAHFGGHESSDSTSSERLWYPMPTRSHYARLGSFQNSMWIFLGDGLWPSTMTTRNFW